MTLNKNNWFAIYYNWIYGKYPNDVCSFFWGTFIMILLSPFIVVGKIITLLSHDSELKTMLTMQVLIGVIIWALIFIIVVIGNFVLKLFGYKFIYLWAVVLGGFSLGMLFFSTVTAFGYLGGKLCQRIANTSIKTPGTNLIENAADIIGAIRGKYCTKITWKE